MGISKFNAIGVSRRLATAVLLAITIVMLGTTAFVRIMPAFASHDGQTYYRDADADGFGDASNQLAPDTDIHDGYVTNNSDCDDSNASISPIAVEIANSIDDDCDGLIDEDFPDFDGDGTVDPIDIDADNDSYIRVPDGGDDCDDLNPVINPDAIEIAGDGIDQNCDGIDDPLTDADADGFDSSIDCDDSDSSVYPGATEIVGDGIDNNCDGSIDEGPVDADGDGYVDVQAGGSDCDDSNALVNPNVLEIPGDGIDQNCDGIDGSTPPGSGVSKPTTIVESQVVGSGECMVTVQKTIHDPITVDGSVIESEIITVISTCANGKQSTGVTNTQTTIESFVVTCSMDIRLQNMQCTNS